MSKANFLTGAYNRAFSLLWQFMQNLATGSRCALFMRFQVWHFSVSFFQLVLLIACSVVLPLVYQYYQAPTDIEISFTGLYYQAFLYVVFFFSVALIANLQGERERVVQLAVIFLAINPIMFAVSIAIMRVFTNLPLESLFLFWDTKMAQWVGGALFFVWFAWVVSRIFNQLFCLSVYRLAGYVTIFVLFNFGAAISFPYESFWIPKRLQYGNAIAKQKLYKAINVEEVYYLQNELMQGAFANLKPQRKGMADLYFIGYAGDATEDVFKNEAQQAKAIFDREFDTRRRSLLLVNNTKTAYSLPLANRHNLRAAIFRMAELMNRQEDMLVIFMTSHGSKHHKISSHFPNFKLDSVSPTMLKQMLEEAGIKWRIAIISACYSGGFIEPLANKESLIITAASAGRQSFGCGHHGIYTYFGEALIGNNLRPYYPIMDAFEKTKKEITAREQAEGFKPSLPQIYLGTEIAPRLEVVWTRLSKTAPNNWAIQLRD